MIAMPPLPNPGSVPASRRETMGFIVTVRRLRWYSEFTYPLYRGPRLGVLPQKIFEYDVKICRF